MLAAVLFQRVQGGHQLLRFIGRKTDRSPIHNRHFSLRQQRRKTGRRGAMTEHEQAYRLADFSGQTGQYLVLHAAANFLHIIQREHHWLIQQAAKFPNITPRERQPVTALGTVRHGQFFASARKLAGSH